MFTRALTQAQIIIHAIDLINDLNPWPAYPCNSPCFLPVILGPLTYHYSIHLQYTFSICISQIH